MAAGENRNDPAGRPKRQNGSAIRDFRRKSGMSRQDLAERVGIKYPHIANIENEHNNASFEVLYRLANALTVDIRSVLRNPPTHDEIDTLAYDDARERAS